jgi:hypothetical protein
MKILRQVGNDRLQLGAIPPKVIDSFNTHITDARRPNLAHSMLCHLAQRARMCAQDSW